MWLTHSHTQKSKRLTHREFNYSSSVVGLQQKKTMLLHIKWFAKTLFTIFYTFNIHLWHSFLCAVHCWDVCVIDRKLTENFFKAMEIQINRFRNQLNCSILFMLGGTCAIYKAIRTLNERWQLSETTINKVYAFGLSYLLP